VREYAAKLGLPADLRLADEAESELLGAEVADALLEERYAAADPEFLNAVEYFSDSKSDARFLATVNKIRTSLSAYPDPAAFLRGLMRTPDLYTAELVNYARQQAEYGGALIEDALRTVCADAKLQGAYEPALSAFAKLFEAVSEAQDYAKMRRTVLDFTPIAFKPAKGSDEALRDYAKNRRDEAKELYVELTDKVLFLSEDEIASDTKVLTGPMWQIIDFLEEYEARLTGEKLSRRMLDFTDLARHMYKLTVDEDGRPTAEARRIAAQYAEIFVDEYQDTNTLQDAVFEAVSRGGENLFMVGDVKQSIYRFRKAQPKIFVEKKLAYEAGVKGESVSLNRNFRSRKSVLDFVNAVFGALMTRQVGEIDYKGEELSFGSLAYGETPDPVPQLVLLRQNEEGDKGAESEADYVAHRIAALLKEGTVTDKETGRPRPARPSDIAVLTRTRAQTPALMRALEEREIPAYAEAPGSFFERDEISTALSLLAVVDNPMQDVHLAGVMLSPMFGFSPEELAEMRLSRRDRPLWDNVCRAAKDDEKVLDFTRRIEGYREFARTATVEKVLLYAFEDTGYQSVAAAMPDGALRVLNLRLLLDYAAAFEAAAFRGVFAFNHYIRRVVELGRELPGALAAAEGGDLVQLMTIHKSKGLEFPIVILCDTARAFNAEYKKEPVLVQDEIGVGLKLRDTGRMVEYDTVQRAAVSLKLTREAMSEELRCLYVALTRAKEQLIVVMDGRSTRSTVAKLPAPLVQGGIVHPVRAAQCRSLGEMLLCAAHAARLPVSEVRLGQAESPDKKEKAEKEAPEVPLPPAVDFTYPHGGATVIPTKLTVTRISDMYPAEGAVAEGYSRPSAFRRPKFITGKVKATGAEAGTATHELIQFADLAALAAGPEAEAVRLLEAGFISAEQYAAIDYEKVARFTRGELFSRMAGSDEVMREVRFNTLMPASELLPYVPDTPSGEEVLVQGVIDCVFREGEHYTIVDYKTDHIAPGEMSALAGRYAVQLRLYRRALSQMAGTSDIETVIYSFALDESVKVN
ncbi:MAG TPA: 3'-5' exonuclease, partial [Terriglobales bacterium]|nr:3'-5' exonuclease [Terriglobales bacterium]